MKKLLCIWITLVMVFAMSACAQTDKNAAADGGSSADGFIDVDLTLLSSTMVYSEVFNMTMTPEDYLGKTVKMRGTYTVYDGEIRKYHACLIADATACCAQGIEFALTKDYQYPDDYPQEGTEITVVGIFDTYREGSYQYFQLSSAKIVK